MPRDYVCRHIDRAIEIDGRLDKAEWKSAPWSEPFVDILGDAGPAPHLSTRVKMVWDDRYLYIGAELEEPHVWATLTQRDAVILQDNDFEVFIDPDGDNHLYYEIEINALNTVWDLLLIKPYRDGGPAVNGWDMAGLKTAVHVDGTLNDPTDKDVGWSIEMALPWAALKECANRPSPPANGDTWRINFSRVQWSTSIRNGAYVKTPNRPEDNWVWSPQGVVDMHRPERWGYVTFSRHPNIEKNSPIYPSYAASERARELLMSIYYAQRQYFKVHGCFAHELAALNIEPSLLKSKSMRGKVTIECMAAAFVACTEVTATDEATSEKWFIREDSRIWSSRVG